MKLENQIRFYALKNAIKYKSEVNFKNVFGQILSNNPEHRKNIEELRNILKPIIDEINSLSFEEKKNQFSKFSGVEKKEKRDKKDNLPPLKNVETYKEVIMRIAPFPSGPLHVGNARMVILNDEYVKKYKGKLLLVFDDTIGGGVKEIYPPAYDMIPENLDFLGVKPHKTYYKSDRLEIYYKYIKELIQKNQAYVCKCEATTFREKYKKISKECPHRDQDIETNLEQWEQMLAGQYQPGEIVVRLKSGMELPNPALRDHVLMRLSDKIHPRVGSKYVVWPLLEYNWAIDDHLLNVSHILRGKDLMKEDEIEKIIWKIFNWRKSEFIHYGFMKVDEMTISKSKALALIEKKEFTSWDDPRTWSLNSIKKRGINPKAFKKAIIDLGLSVVDIKFSPKTIYAYNRMIIDNDTPRAFFIDNSVRLTITNVQEKELSASIRKYPLQDKGLRKLTVSVNDQNSEVLISRNDVEKFKENKYYRLKDLCNIQIKSISEDKNSVTSVFHSKEMDPVKELKAKIIHWLPKNNNVDIKLTLTDGTDLVGLGENSILDYEYPQMIQFERYGFVNLIKKNPIEAYFAHK
ncbi:MAG: glutamate--tRNA ligase [Candidatus Ranarchaeia archaeon]